MNQFQEILIDVALRWLVRRDWKGIDGGAVHGPEDLSFAEAAATIGRVLERPVRYEQISADEYGRRMVNLGATTEYTRSRVEMFDELARGITRAEPRTHESTTPTRLIEWSERELRPAMQSHAEASRSSTRSEPLRLAKVRAAETTPQRAQLVRLT